ncbi:hypothetical protein GALMADRAFT_248009 [Galerina marginata CBS 339.88]|uniref:SCP domain-containing protein n=1 Tax=Galerina marginata (strain CBS 339.88) TaxID=685588 RepID=A0A067T979_GALM3|nr:hypothetical protein GALMADRAFT_248009 [Galerina marginata CBS 339.88]
MSCSDAWSDQVVSVHNSYRARYGAGPLAWSASLYPDTLVWAQECQFQHSNSAGNYGENLYFTTGNTDTLASGVKAWMDEAPNYNYNNPDFSAATGHFTQVVWKGTTQVACAVGDCAAGTVAPMAGKFLVCRYSPPGNYLGQFPQNVGMPQ